MRRVASALAAVTLAATVTLGGVVAANANPIMDAVNGIVNFFTSAADEGVSTADVQWPEHTIPTVTPQGTTINLFDYWTNGDRNSNDYYSYDRVDGLGGPGSNYNESGINNNHQLKFNTGGAINANVWTGIVKGIEDGKVPLQGIVNNVLDADGFPRLNGSSSGTGITSNESLAYLFNSNDANTEGDGRVDAKLAFTNTKGLLTVDDNGYYSYDSQENFATFDEDTNEFTVYDTDAVKARPGDKQGNLSFDGQFFPFADLNDVLEESGGKLRAKEKYAKDNGLNHYFGLTMTSRFVQSKDGMTDDGAEPVTYEFRGDDDVWVFIDGVLVGDVGGIHSASELKIDFSTGKVSVTGKQGTTIRECFTNAGRTWTNGRSDTFADDSLHTLKFFYLERGSGDSNLRLKFNLKTVPDSEIVKLDQTGNVIAGAEFALYPADRSYNKTSDTPIFTGVTGADGTLTLVDSNDVLINFDELWRSHSYQYYVLEETKTPSGYRGSAEMHLHYITGQGVLVSENQWDTAAYANARVMATAPSKLFDIDGDEVPTDSSGRLEQGHLFAIIMKRTGTGNLDQNTAWQGIKGSVKDGWSLTDGDGSSLDNILTADKYEMTLNTNGLYEVTIDELPGDVRTYYSVIHGASGELNKTQYAIGYYYTSADSLDGANANNTKRLDSDNSYGHNVTEFQFQYAAKFNIANIYNRVLVQKLDDAGNPVTGAEFTLYKDANGTDAVGTVTTRNLTKDSDGINLEGAGVFSGLDKGTYYLKETKAPEGYKLNETMTKIFIDDNGVYADAGTTEDGVSVARGVGTLVKSMEQFGGNEYLDATLHDITAHLQTGDDPSGNDGAKWVDADPAQTMELKFSPEHANLEYVPMTTNGASWLIADTGWPNLRISQNMTHDDGDRKQNLGDQDLTQLFSGTVTVRVTNERVTDLDISKTVTGYAGISNEDLEKLQAMEFTFQLSLQDANGNALTGEYQGKVVDSNGDPVKGADGKDLTFVVRSGKATFSLAHGQHAVVQDVPFGTKWEVIEDPSNVNGFTASVNSNDADAVLNNGKVATEDTSATNASASGVIKDVDTSTADEFETVTVAFTNGYAVEKTTVPAAAFAGTKTLSGRDWTADDQFTFVIERAKGTDANAPLPNPAKKTLKGSELEGGLTGSDSKAYGFNFGELEFTKPGTYVYSIYEQQPTNLLPGMSYSQAFYRVTVQVTDKDDNEVFTGKLKAETTIERVTDDAGNLVTGDAAKADKASFINTYNEKAAAFTISGRKSYKENGVKQNDIPTFDFELKAVQGKKEGEADIAAGNVPMPDGTKNGVYKTTNDDASITFGSIVYDMGDVGYTYTYKVCEIPPEGAPEGDNPEVNGTTYDAKTYTVTVTVSVNANNVLQIDAQYVDTEDADKSVVLFENSYAAKSATGVTVSGYKTLKGDNADPNKGFDFTLEPLNEAARNGIADKSITYNKDNGNKAHVDGSSTSYEKKKFSFGDMTFTKKGTYTFTMKEVVPNGVTSQKPKQDGMTYDTKPVTVTITVTDEDGKGNKTGQLVATVTYGSEDSAPTFTNAYAESGSQAITGTKTLTGRNFQSGDSFKFKVEPKTDGAPKPSEVTEENNEWYLLVNPSGDNSVVLDFGSVSFTEPGKSYTYELSEVDPQATDDKGLGYDATRYQVTVSSKAFSEQEHKGELATEISIKKVVANGTEDATALTWANTYEASGAAALTGNKVLQNIAWADAGSFSFKLEAFGELTETAIKNNDIDMPSETMTRVVKDDVKNGKAPFTFNNITFKKTTASGAPYIFKITEVTTDSNGASIDDDENKQGVQKDGITYDEHVCYVRVTVSDNGDGTLKVTPRYSTTPDGVQSESTANAFTNIYEATGAASTPIEVTKDVNGHEPIGGGYSFDLTLVNADQVQNVVGLGTDNKLTVETDGSLTEQNNQKLTFKTVDNKDLAFSAEGTYVFTIQETTKSPNSGWTHDGKGVNEDTPKHYVAVKVVDNKKGGFTIESVKYDTNDKGEGGNTSLTITNEYKQSGSVADTVAVTKDVNGHAPIASGYTFVLKADQSHKFTQDNLEKIGGLTNGSVSKKTSDKLSVDQDDVVEFPLTFSAEGEYHFILQETTTEPNNAWTHDNAEHKVIVTVGDNDEGGYKVSSITYDGKDHGVNATDSLKVTNTYTSDVSATATLNLSGTKTLKSDVDRKFLQGDSFTFSVKAIGKNAGDAPVPSGVNGEGNLVLSFTENSDKATADLAFGTLVFDADDKGKTFIYEITEVQDSNANDGITNNTGKDSYTVTVKVGDNDQGGIKLNVTASNDGTNRKFSVTGNEGNAVKVTGVDFTNTYSVTGDGLLNLSGKKTITGRDFVPGDEFSFLVKGESTKNDVKAPLPEKTATGNEEITLGADNTAKVTIKPKSGNTHPFSYGAIKFGSQHVGGTYTYTVTEENGGSTSNGITYAANSYTFSVKVENDNKGGIKLAVTNLTQKETRAAGQTYVEEVNYLDFNNVYETGGDEVETGVDTNVVFSKKLTGRDWKEDDQFNFTLKAETPNAPLPKKDGVENKTATVNNSGGKNGSSVKFGFGTITFTDKDLEDVTANPATGVKSKDFVYEVTEDNYHIPGVKPAKENQTATLTIKVTDDGKGTMTATPQVTDGEFVNEYKITGDARLELSGDKTITGRDFKRGDKFQFMVTGESSDGSKAPLPTGEGVEVDETTNTATVTVEPDAGREIAIPYGSINFTKDHIGTTFTYTVKEVKGGTTENGVSYDSAVHTFDAKVDDDGQGGLSLYVRYPSAGKERTADKTTSGEVTVLNFENRYAAKPATLGGEGSVKIEAIKQLANREQVAGEFTFNVTNAKAAADAKPVATGTNAADGTISFSGIEYTTEQLEADCKAGIADCNKAEGENGAYTYTYDYAVAEDTSKLPEGVSAVAPSFNVKVTVTDKLDGSPLDIKVAYPDGQNSLTFQNAYGTSETAKVNVNGTKTLNVLSGDNAPDITGKYTFTLTGSEGAPMPKVTTATNDKAGDVSFGDIEYTMENVFGATGDEPTAAAEGEDADAAATATETRTKTFTYAVKESGSVPGVTNDPAAQTGKTFTVTVTDNGDGTISAKADPAGAKFAFVNTYQVTPTESTPTGEGALTVTKTLTGRDMAKGEFTFELLNEAGQVVASGKNEAAKAGEAVKVQLSSVKFDRPGSYNFTLHEVEPTEDKLGGVEYDPATYAVTAKVTDNGDGTLSVTWSSSDKTLAFHNEYKVAETTLTVGASKVLEGADLKDGQFTFQLTNSFDEVRRTAKNDANGTVVFEPLRFDRPGVYEYTISEVNDGQDNVEYDKNTYHATVTVTDNGAGQLVAEVAYENGAVPVFKNTYVEPKEPSKPTEPEPSEPKGEEPKEPEGELPQTGDNAPSMGLLAAIGAAGVAMIAGGAVLVKRRK